MLTTIWDCHSSQSPEKYVVFGYDYGPFIHTLLAPLPIPSRPSSYSSQASPSIPPFLLILPSPSFLSCHKRQ